MEIINKINIYINKINYLELPFTINLPNHETRGNVLVVNPQHQTRDYITGQNPVKIDFGKLEKCALRIISTK